MIWLCLLIPMATIIFCAVKFGNKMAWWEYILQFAIPLILIVVSKLFSVSSQTKDSEQWNMYLTSATHIEYWSTWVDDECCTTDSDGNETCVDCSYCDENGAYWEAIDNCGNVHRITEHFYRQLVRLWGNEKFIELYRSIDRYGGCGVDGDQFITSFGGSFDNLVPVTETHSYKNKVKASKDVFNFPEVSLVGKMTYELYEYPKSDRFNYKPILGDNNPEANKKLFQYNGLLGSEKQLHMLIAVFHNKDANAAFYQENYWKGGNKNEVILCIGLDNTQKIKWTKLITWCEDDRLKIDIEKTVLNMNYDLIAIIDYMAKECKNRYKRKEFADFNYIQIKPTTTAVIITFILTLLCSIGLAIWCVKNDFTFDDPANNGNGYRHG